MIAAISLTGVLIAILVAGLVYWIASLLVPQWIAGIVALLVLLIALTQGVGA